MFLRNILCLYYRLNGVQVPFSTLYAPSYWATSSPSINTRSSFSISSSMAELRASLTVICWPAAIALVVENARLGTRLRNTVSNISPITSISVGHRQKIVCKFAKYCSRQTDRISAHAHANTNNLSQCNYQLKNL